MEIAEIKKTETQEAGDLFQFGKRIESVEEFRKIAPKVTIFLKDKTFAPGTLTALPVGDILLNIKNGYAWTIKEEKSRVHSLTKAGFKCPHEKDVIHSVREAENGFIECKSGAVFGVAFTVEGRIGINEIKAPKTEEDPKARTAEAEAGKTVIIDTTQKAATR